jgi:hypothetical protein
MIVLCTWTCTKCLPCPETWERGYSHFHFIDAVVQGSAWLIRGQCGICTHSLFWACTPLGLCASPSLLYPPSPHTQCHSPMLTHSLTFSSQMWCHWAHNLASYVLCRLQHPPASNPANPDQGHPGFIPSIEPETPHSSGTPSLLQPLHEFPLQEDLGKQKLDPSRPFSSRVHMQRKA